MTLLAEGIKRLEEDEPTLPEVTAEEIQQELRRESSSTAEAVKQQIVRQLSLYKSVRAKTHDKGRTILKKMALLKGALPILEQKEKDEKSKNKSATWLQTAFVNQQESMQQDRQAEESPWPFRNRMLDPPVGHYLAANQATAPNSRSGRSSGQRQLEQVQKGRLHSLKDDILKRSSSGSDPDFTAKAGLRKVSESRANNASLNGGRLLHEAESHPDTKNLLQPAIDYDDPPWHPKHDKHKPTPRELSGTSFYSRYEPSGNASPRSGRVTRAPKRAQGNAPPIEISSDDEMDTADARHNSGQSAAAADTRELRRTTRSNAYKSLTEKLEGLKALYPEGGGPDSVQIVASDMSRLEPDEFLNDTVIDFFIKHIQMDMEKMSPGSTSRFLFFNSFFFKKLTEKSFDNDQNKSKHEQNYERVRKWTKGKDVFAKDYLFVPIHDHLHWSLLVVCFPAAFILGNSGQKTCMLHLDSMDGGHNVQTVTSAMRGYLTEEWKRQTKEEGSVAYRWRRDNPDAPTPDFNSKNIPGRKPNHVPKQDNYCDCGLFTLTYVHYFTFVPPTCIDPDKLTELAEEPEAYPLFLTKHWFRPGNAGALRAHLRWLILDLFVQQASDECQAKQEAVVERDDLRSLSLLYQGPSETLAENARLAAELERKALEKAQRDSQQKAAKEAQKAEKERVRAAAALDRRQSKLSFAVQSDPTTMTGRVAAALSQAGDASQEDIEVTVDDESVWEDSLQATQVATKTPPKQAKISKFCKGSGGYVEPSPSKHVRFEDLEVDKSMELFFSFQIKKEIQNGEEKNIWQVTHKQGADVLKGEDLPCREFSLPTKAYKYMQREVARLTSNAHSTPGDSGNDDECSFVESKKRRRLVSNSERYSKAAAEGATPQDSGSRDDRPPRSAKANFSSETGNQTKCRKSSERECQAADEAVVTIESEEEKPDPPKRQKKETNSTTAKQKSGSAIEEGRSDQKDSRGMVHRVAANFMNSFSGITSALGVNHTADRQLDICLGMSGSQVDGAADCMQPQEVNSPATHNGRQVGSKQKRPPTSCTALDEPGGGIAQQLHGWDDNGRGVDSALDHSSFQNILQYSEDPLECSPVQKISNDAPSRKPCNHAKYIEQPGRQAEALQEAMEVAGRQERADALPAIDPSSKQCGEEGTPEGSAGFRILRSLQPPSNSAGPEIVRKHFPTLNVCLSKLDTPDSQPETSSGKPPRKKKRLVQDMPPAAALQLEDAARNNSDDHPSHKGDEGSHDDGETKNGVAVEAEDVCWDADAEDWQAGKDDDCSQLQAEVEAALQPMSAKSKSKKAAHRQAKIKKMRRDVQRHQSSQAGAADDLRENSSQAAAAGPDALELSSDECKGVSGSLQEADHKMQKLHLTSSLSNGKADRLTKDGADIQSPPEHKCGDAASDASQPCTTSSSKWKRKLRKEADGAEAEKEGSKLPPAGARSQLQHYLNDTNPCSRLSRPTA